jgi:Mlc titration factor MtfA (ptsG expression regulator)
MNKINAELRYSLRHPLDQIAVLTRVFRQNTTNLVHIANSIRSTLKNHVQHNPKQNTRYNGQEAPSNTPRG